MPPFLAAMSTIRKLPESTIKLIAAGEIITRPVNIVKELLENSIDAGSTNIRIRTESGGVGLIEIIDNGHGIARVDAELLCHRYATSKLTTADDLTKISTFGFRGEALASVSEMADLKVESWNSTIDKVGWTAQYSNSKLIGGPKEKALQKSGTHLRITNLFFATVGRKNAAESNCNEERKAITELVRRYAIHHSDKITISLKDGASTDLICVIAPMDLRPCIGHLYNIEMQNNMSVFEAENILHYTVKANILFSYKESRSTNNSNHFILFVNDRLVDCGQLKREVEMLAHEYFMAKQYTIFFYIKLKVPPCDLDVNVHPAKATVKLHYQEEIITMIVDVLRSKFVERFGFQPNGAKVLQSASQKIIRELKRSTPQKSTSLVESVVLQPSTPIESTSRLRTLVPNLNTSVVKHTPEFKAPITKRPHDLIHNDSTQQTLTQMRIPPKKAKRDLKLRSINELKKQVAKEKAQEDTSVIKGSVFVGIFDHYKAIIQHEAKLYAINFRSFLKEQLYQFYLFDFGNFPPIDILPPGNNIYFMIDTYLRDLEKHEETSFKKLKFKTSDDIINELLKHSAMYEDYLALKLTKNEILTLPNIIPEETPNLIFLGRFLSDMVNAVDYSEERECFRMIGRVIADFYSEPPANLRDINVHQAHHNNIEIKLYKTIKSYLMIPDWLFTRENICQISDTKDLFKVFERC